jgi:hypothetical protein
VLCKLTVLRWHMITRGEDCAYARPSLTTKKQRTGELKAGHPSRRGQQHTASGYPLKEVRRRERELAEQAEPAYAQMVSDRSCASFERRPTPTPQANATTRHCRSPRPLTLHPWQSSPTERSADGRFRKRR